MDMSKRRRSRIYQIIFFCLTISFLLDAIFMHQLIPWRDDIFSFGHFELNTSISVTATHENKDIRSRSNFFGEFPRIKNIIKKNNTIPKIIHQTWDTEYVPEIFHKWMTTWKRHNPDWEYWFWTLDEIRKLVVKEYPGVLKIYDLYQLDIFRSDVMRYLVLHKYGGIYFDLDMEALKPLDNWTYGFPCIVSEETYEHPFIVRGSDPPGNIVNGFIACRNKHPFLRLAIESLEEFSGYYFGDYLHATGPFFLSSILDRYLKYASKNETDKITILPPKYFFPTYDPSESDIISERCFPGRYQLLKEAAQITCKELLETFFRRSPLSVSFTDHHWVHAYMLGEEWKTRDTKHVHDIVPTAVIRHVV